MTGRIIKIISNEYTVLGDDNIAYLLKPRGKFRYDKAELKVGDIVEFDESTITKIYERKNTFRRPFVSNVDYLIVVQSLKRPDISFELLDRFLVNAEIENVKPIIVFTKLDLLSKEEYDALSPSLSYYEKYYNVFYSNYDGLVKREDFLNLLCYKISVITGQTGAGKSHLLNTLKEGLNLKTQDISDALNRGKHTTRHTELINIDNAYIADTPGFSSLELVDIKSSNLKECFGEFVPHLNECRFNECMHISEPGCMIKELVIKGEILESRYSSYVKLYK